RPPSPGSRGGGPPPAPPPGRPRARRPTAAPAAARAGRARGARSMNDPVPGELQRPEAGQAGAEREPPDRPPALGEQAGGGRGAVLARFRRPQPVQRMGARGEAQRRGVRQARPAAGGAPPPPPPPPAGPPPPSRPPPPPPPPP